MNASTLIVNLSNQPLSKSVVDFCANLANEVSTTLISFNPTDIPCNTKSILNEQSYKRATTSKILNPELAWCLFLEDTQEILEANWEMVICIDDTNLSQSFFEIINAKHKVDHRSFLRLVYENTSIHT